MPKAVGIDLGATNCVVSVLEAGEFPVIPTAEGARMTPSVVGFAKSGEVLVGEAARRQATTNPERTVSSIIRLMGTSWTVDIDGRPHSAEQIGAILLEKLKGDAERFLGDTVAQAVITVPGYCSRAHRMATIAAGRIAGLDVLAVVNAASAVATGHAMGNPLLSRTPTDYDDGTTLVLDLGGAKCDVSVLQIGDDVIEVVATSGDTHLGGDDWDQRIVDWLLQQFSRDHGVDLARDTVALARMKEAAARAKIELSAVQGTEIELPFLAASASGPLHLTYRLTRDTFEKLTADLVKACASLVNRTVNDAGVMTSAIRHVVVVGGSTRRPAIQELVETLFGKRRITGVNNPDDVAAIGAAVCAGVLKGEVRDLLLLEVTPVSIGIETQDGTMTRLVERNTTIPTRRWETFTTPDGAPPPVDVHVLQGDHERASANESLGRVQIGGDAPPKGASSGIEVTLDIDQHGTVHAVATRRALRAEARPSQDAAPQQASPFCRACIDATTAEAAGPISSVNGVGTVLLGKDDPCSECGSVIAMKWRFVFVPVKALGRYRVVHFKTGRGVMKTQMFYSRRLKE